MNCARHRWAARACAQLAAHLVVAEHAPTEHRARLQLRFCARVEHVNGSGPAGDTVTARAMPPQPPPSLHGVVLGGESRRGAELSSSVSDSAGASAQRRQLTFMKLSTESLRRAQDARLRALAIAVAQRTRRAHTHHGTTSCCPEVPSVTHGRSTARICGAARVTVSARRAGTMPRRGGQSDSHERRCWASAGRSAARSRATPPA